MIIIFCCTSLLLPHNTHHIFNQHQNPHPICSSLFLFVLLHFISCHHHHPSAYNKSSFISWCLSSWSWSSSEWSNLSFSSASFFYVFFEVRSVSTDGGNSIFFGGNVFEVRRNQILFLSSQGLPSIIFKVDFSCVTQLVNRTPIELNGNQYPRRRIIITESINGLYSAELEYSILTHLRTLAQVRLSRELHSEVPW